MKTTLSWLNEYVKIDDLSIDFITDKLLNIGFETESVTYLGQEIEGVYSAKILSLSRHPSADRLVICTLDVGGMAARDAENQGQNAVQNTVQDTVQIVTGAPNVKAGDIVCAALCGATLAGGKKINAADFRGVDSFGMLCSGKELGIDNNVMDGAEVDGLLILPPDTKVGQDVRDIFGLNDYVLDIGITANRPDCQSVYGICRELAAALDRPLKPLDLSYKTSSAKQVGSQSLSVQIKDKDICTKFLGRIIGGTDVKPAPQWMRRRLHFLGHSCKNNIVDITNYVLLEVGQPLHAFDKSVIEGGIVVRRATKGEKLIALDGHEYTLGGDMLMIADHKKPLSIAGIKGGEHSGTYPHTKDVFLEAARFARGNIRQTSRALGLRSDSSTRFERGVDEGSPDIGVRRALSLVYKLKAGTILDTELMDGIPANPPKTISFGYNKFKEILGIDIPKTFTKNILKRLCFGVTENKGQLCVTVPDFREDIDNFTDIIEEAARFYGYDKLSEDNLCGAQTLGGISKRRENINIIEQLCCAAGAYEINNYSFIPQRHFDMLGLNEGDKLRQAIRIVNPLSEDYAYMRTQLVSGMLETIRRNQARQNTDFALFEIDNIFLSDELPPKKLPQEIPTLCMGFCKSGTDFYTVKSFVTTLLNQFGLKFEFCRSQGRVFLHPGKSADIIIGGQMSGCFGLLHPITAENFGIQGEVYILGLMLPALVDGTAAPVRVAPLPKYPFVERDLAVVVGESVPAGDIVELVKNSDALVKKVTLFDVYTGNQVESGYKSLALKIVLQNAEKTMTEMEINDIMLRIIENLQRAGATLRQ